MRIEDELRHAASELPAQRAAAKRAGLPLTPQDLRPFPPVADAQNAAPLYRKFERRLTSLPPTDRERRDTALSRAISGTASENERHLARETLADWAPLLQLAEQIAAHPRCDFRLAWERVPDTPFPPYTPMRAVARLLSARAVFESEDGRVDDAVRCLRAAGQIQRHIGEEPILLALLAQDAVDRILDQAFIRIIRRHGSEPDALRLAADTNRVLTAAPGLRHYFRGEVLFGVAGARNPRKVLLTDEGADRNPQQKEADRLLAQCPDALLRDAFEARILAFYRRLFAALEKAGPEPRNAYDALTALVAAEAGHTEPSCRYTRDGVAIFPQSALRPAQVVARQRMRGTLVALLESRLRNGTFPEALPNAPADPFDQKPLRYRKTPTGFILYSIGLNLKDDGGDPGPAIGGPPDMVITYP